MTALSEASRQSLAVVALFCGLASFGAAQSASAQGARGSDLLMVCSNGTEYAEGLCDGMISSTVDGFYLGIETMLIQNGQVSSFAEVLEIRPQYAGFCFPEEFSPADGLRPVIISFIEQNAAAQDANLSIAVVEALRTTFPCPEQ